MTFTKIHVLLWRARNVLVSRGDSGASMVEYGLLLALVAIVCLVAVTFIGETTKSNLTSTASQIG